jgi:transcriptional regulator with XRE-family HTH domain
MKTFGQFLKKIREKDGLTQADLGRMMDDLDTSTIRYLETSDRLPHLKTIQLLADAFNMKGWQLLKKYEEWK